MNRQLDGRTIKRMNRTYIIVGVAAALAVAVLGVLTGTGALDIIGARSASAFANALDAMPGAVKEEPGRGGWSVSAPDGSVKFIWGRGSGGEGTFVLAFELDASPFLEAGVEAERLPSGMLSDGLITLGRVVALEAGKGGTETGPAALYRSILASDRASVSYHADMDHFGMSLGNGNVFEWAKDLVANDKDIVFVLDPGPFISAGVDVSRVQGWTFAKVKVEDRQGRMIEVDKLLKPFSID